ATGVRGVEDWSDGIVRGPRWSAWRLFEAPCEPRLSMITMSPDCKSEPRLSRRVQPRASFDMRAQSRRIALLREITLPGTCQTRPTRHKGDGHVVILVC